MITDYAMGTTVSATRSRRAADPTSASPSGPCRSCATRSSAEGASCTQARSAALRLLGLNRATLDAFAAELQAQEVLERGSIERIVAQAAPPRPRLAASSRREPPVG